MSVHLKGERFVRGVAAGVAVDLPEFAAEVAAVEAAVKAEAAKYDDTGAFRRSVGTGRDRYRGVEDHVVYSDDPAAYSIEFGHSTKSGSHVPGNFVFTNVARRLGR